MAARIHPNDVSGSENSGNGGGSSGGGSEPASCSGHTPEKLCAQEVGAHQGGIDSGPNMVDDEEDAPTVTASSSAPAATAAAEEPAEGELVNLSIHGGCAAASPKSQQQATRDDGSTAAATKLGITSPRYPMFIISGASLRKLDTLIPHEQALASGLLRKVVRVETEGRKSNKKIVYQENGAKGASKEKEVLGSDVYFISHRWLRPTRDPATSHPDDERGTKLKSLKSFVHPRKFVWIDYVCCPQQAGTKKLRCICSLPYYTRCCERFTALVVGAAGRKEYLSRTWCQAELIMSKVPERLPQFRAAWMHTRGRFYDIADGAGGYNSRISVVLLKDLADLSECHLTVAADAQALVPLLAYAASELEQMLEFDALPVDQRTASKMYGSGQVGIDEDNEVWDVPRWEPVRRKDVEAALVRLRTALAKPPYSTFLPPQAGGDGGEAQQEESGVGS